MHDVPEFNTTVDSDHLLAVASVDDRMLLLLDIDALISSADLGLINKAST